MDNLLREVKDFSAIKKYLEAINQTTDDFLYMYDIKENSLQFFGNINKVFNVNGVDREGKTIEDILSIVHNSDRKGLVEDIKKLRSGEKDSHNLDFRMFNIKGEKVWVNSRAKVLRDEAGVPHVAIGRLSEEALRHLYNPITVLWNRTKLRGDMKTRLTSGKGWLMMLEIPNLADINLTHGRNYSNEMLKEMADIFGDIEYVERAYHIDHNRFALTIKDCVSSNVETIYEGIRQFMEEKCSVMAGVVPIDKTVFIDALQLIDSAVVTLKNAVENETEEIVFFSSEEIDRRITELTLLEELKESVLNGFEGFEVNYQPQIKSGTYALHGVEALLRYNSPERGRVFPDEFIPILEQTGLIEEVGMWVLDEALKQCKKWRKDIPDLQVAVNFSSVQFDDYHLADKIYEALKKADLPGSALTVELTESIQLNENYFNLIKEIKSYGVRFSIDDFGTGYSNLAYLKQLDVNEIKIDRSFVTEIEKDTYNYRIISNLLEFSRTNSIGTCLEGVETAKELTILEPLQADVFQGYLFDKPCSAEEIHKKYICTSSEEYKKRMNVLDEIYAFKEQFGSIHFDPKNILHENGIGLWIMRIDETKGRYELHADEEMKKVFAIDEKLTPSECYKYWLSHVSEADIETVNNGIKEIVANGKTALFDYRWMHPEKGEMFIRFSCAKKQDVERMVTIEGLYRILKGVEGA